MRIIKDNYQNKVKLGLVFINGGRFGGPEKRVGRIANWISNNTDIELFVYVSRRLFNWLRYNNIILSDNIKLSLYDETGSSNNKNEKKEFNAIKEDNNLVKKIIPEKLKIIKNIIIQSYRLHRWVKNNKIQILHGWHGAGEIMLPLKLFNKVKLIYSITGSYGTIGIPAKWIGNLSYKSVFRFSDIIDFLSEGIKYKYEELGLKTSENRTSIGICSFIEIEKMFIAQKERLIVAGAARYEPQKNILLFVEVANCLINKKSIDVKFEILGPKMGSEEILKKINHYNLEDHITINYEKRPETILSKSLIFLSLQDVNNYPSQLLLEAMACGCAIIATDVGETEKLVDDKVGFLVDKNINKIVDRINIIMEDQEKAKSLGLNARKRILSTHIIERYGEYLLNIYKTAMV